MSVGPLGGLAGSVAGTPLAQSKGSEVERSQQDSAGQQRRVQNDLKAEAAAAIGETDGEDHQAADRDADGRRLWERLEKPSEEESPETDASRPKDASGQAGSLLDLSG